MKRIAHNLLAVLLFFAGAHTAQACFFIGEDPGDVSNNDFNRNPSECTYCSIGSETAVATGNLRIEHTLVGYRSLSESRALTLRYSSNAADPRPVVSTAIDVVREDLEVISARLEVPNVFAGQEIFTDASSIPPDGELRDIRQALQFDASASNAGVYPYKVTHTFYRSSGETRTVTIEGTTIVQNAVNSPFGAGWGLVGLSRITELDDGSVLLLGGGLALVFSPGGDGTFVSPPGDFSTLLRLEDGMFVRRLKDGTTFLYLPDGLPQSVTDRNGNTTVYSYDENGVLRQIEDPLGLSTTLEFDAAIGRYARIVDPQGRQTTFDYIGGDLVSITDPDGSVRRFVYDERHRMTSQTANSTLSHLSI